VARRFGLDVVAEGVETALQRSHLEALGVNYLQGYLFGRPMPNDQFVAWLGLHDGSDEPFVLRA
jgi:EAL domain-containing protein (putative c-di-GMP-specific phosphodiesterase class I)